ncbi:unnamed protein product [Medioppia subpectinata]|uniref:2-amino-3-ketobutyrate coenzyme A ligase, mitochondrial n=1 Tax=Medioppia subpectinata TaxID=1979941 RepID=A0A7R9Q7Y0_9ACAR|nr:unnamed protein product [Medioppia subpectinata]CAG2116316.1 unnamed protein product [Medioppia subpectinata]
MYASCFDANAGLFEALLSAEDAIISDELNHASIIDGIRLSKAQRFRYKHRDMNDLEDILKNNQKARNRLIATDGVFSMDGNVAPLNKIYQLAQKYNAIVFVDECHSTGFFGNTGRGTEEFFNLSGKIDIINSTLGKALGGAAGGYTTGNKELIDLLRQRSRPYLFSNSLPPAVVASASKVFDLLTQSSALTERVKRNTTVFRTEMKSFGFNILSNAEVISAGKDALDKYGSGLSSVRFICGTQDIHKALEAKIAKFHGREDAILYASCFDANAGLFEALLSAEDAIISDELNHASIIDGIRLSKAQRFRYKHRDMNDLEDILKNNQKARNRLIATDGVFSMDGNVAPLNKIYQLAQKYNAIVFVDECHSTGFFGNTGRGTEEFFNLSGKIDIINSTLGKALGGAAGGYTTGNKELIDLLRQRSRPYLFSNSLPPAVVASASKVFDLLTQSSALTERVKRNTTVFRTEMKSFGFNILGDDHPICPVFIGDARLATNFADQMLENGIYVIGFSYPVVPKGKARIRVQISAAHSDEDIKKTIDAFVKVGRKLQVI